MADPPWSLSTSYDWESESLYHVARLEDATGETDVAREHYREFLARWGEADMPIPIVRDARDRLAALGD